jgi:hypothetical protein
MDVKGTKSLALRSPLITKGVPACAWRAPRARVSARLGLGFLVGTDMDLEKQGANEVNRGGKDKTVKDNRKAPNPAWTDALQQIYGTVLDESLPREIQDLLNKLDSKP